MVSELEGALTTAFECLDLQVKSMAEDMSIENQDLPGLLVRIGSIYPLEFSPVGQ
jgi:hypothetical protein